MPFISIGEQAVGTSLCARRLRKIARAESLQRMLLRDGGQQLGARFVRRCMFALLLGLGARQQPALRQMVAQLAYQYRRRPGRAVADAAAHPADVELLARRQQRFEQQVAVVVAARTVAGPVLLAHQIKIEHGHRARVSAVVHAQQAHQLERNGAHRHERAKTH